MTRAKLIKEHGEHWQMYIVKYRAGAQLPCVDCGHETIERSLGNDEEAVCGECSAWRLGRAEGAKEAWLNAQAEIKRLRQQIAVLAGAAKTEAA